MGTAKGVPCAQGIRELIDSFEIPKIDHKLIESIRDDRNTLIQVINGTILYESGPSDEVLYERHRRESFLELLNDSLPYLEKKDFELVISVKDCCSGTGPIFSVTRCKDTMQLPFVQWNKVRDGPFNKWNQRMAQSRDRVKKISWEKRKNTAVFRGSVAPRWSFDHNGAEGQTRLTNGNWRRVGRTILAHLANEIQKYNYLDVELRFATDKVSEYPFKEAEKEISMTDQARKFKYTVIVEGNCGWADRFKSFLSMGTMCLVQETYCKEYYTLLARPNQDYIPVSGTLSNLTTAIQWSRDNDQQAKLIAENGMKFADKYLTESSMRCYMRELFAAYQRQYSGRVPIDRGLIMFTALDA